ncbi:DNA internalization-related competence protein ComEC/Rec2 [Kangiella marina]|uniref:DNA internalization-related competence protein ComEC/Rec2 n=2 Tax=Kangiella marina TaxID=1079178 RepID=A0ABP8IAW0_9GAMM
MFGLGWSSTHASWRLSQQTPSPHNESVHIIEAEVNSLPAIYPEYCQFSVDIISSKTLELVDKELRLKDYSKECLYELGDKWSMTIKLKPIYGPVNEVGFDYEYYAFEQGFDGKGYVKSSVKIQSGTSIGINALRQHIYKELARFNNSGLFQALLIGEKSGISRHDKELLRQLGLSHLNAISGLHIAIIAGASFWLFFKFLAFSNRIMNRSRVEPLRPALIISAMTALLYAALADFSLPTVRATIMWCCVVLALLSQRQGAFLSGLQWALLVILLFDPLSVLSASFWMSFIAVCVISFMVSGRVARSQGLGSKLASLTKIQIGISTTLLLPSVYFFQQATLLGLFVNILVIPIFSLLILPAIILSVIAYMLLSISFPMEWLDKVISSLLGWGKDLASILDNMIMAFSLPAWLVIGVFALTLLCLLPLGRLIYGFAALGVIIVCWHAVVPPHKTHEPKLVVFDVGHGLAALLTDGKHHILYDTGYGAAHNSAFNSYIQPYLLRNNIKQLDALILSHKDNDHSGGTQHILEQFKVQQLVAGRWALGKFHQREVELCQAGYLKTIGAFQLEVIHPNVSSTGDNNDSCVLKVKARQAEQDFSILMTGDIEKDTELDLAEHQTDKLRANLLLVPHHGSNSSSTYPFIKMVLPETAIYSTERYSRYHLPNQNVVRRYHTFDVKQLHTGCTGQITYFLTQDKADWSRNDAKIWRKKPCEMTEL